MSRKIIFAGPTGSGKTTAISTITDKPLVSMVVEHRGCVEASDTLVAETFNYGVLNLQDGRSVHLYEVQETQDIRNGCDVVSGQLK